MIIVGIARLRTQALKSNRFCLHFHSRKNTIKTQETTFSSQSTTTIRLPPGYWTNLENQRTLFEILAQKFGIRQLDDWYGVTSRQVSDEGGATLLNNYYNGSLLAALKAVYPEHTWRTDIPEAHKVANFWKDPNNLRQMFDNAAKELQISSLEDWYRISRARLYSVRSDAKSALRYHASSLVDALILSYPEHPWLPWKFTKVRAGYWDSKAAQKQFMDWAGQQLSVVSFEDWYRVSGTQVDEMGGKYLIEHFYRHSLPEALKHIYPDHPWDDAKFLYRTKEFWERKDMSTRNEMQNQSEESPPRPSGHWSDLSNLRALVHQICDAKGISISNLPSIDLYSISAQDIIAAGGASPLRRYFESSPVKLLKAVFPDHKWLEWKFLALQRGWWSSIDNQRLFLDWTAKNVFGFDPATHPESWYNISARKIHAAGGSRLLTKYDGSPGKLLAAAYPHHAWKSWRFKQVPSGFWESIDDMQLKQYVEEISTELAFADVSAWYRVSWAQLQSIGAAHIFVRLGGVKAVLQRVFPDQLWDTSRFSDAAASEAAFALKASRQASLCDALRRMLPTDDIIEEFFLSDPEGGAYSFSAALANRKVLWDVDPPADQASLKASLCHRNGFKYLQISEGQSLEPEVLIELIGNT